MSDADLKNEEILTRIQQMNADTAKLVAEAAQFRMSTILAPFIAGAGVVGATAAIMRIFFT